MNKKLIVWMVFVLMVSCSQIFAREKHNDLKFFPASNKAIHFVGRIDLSNKAMPRLWSPGVYFYTTFKGPNCFLILHNDVQNGNLMDNYIEVVVDGKTSRIKLPAKSDTIQVAKNLPEGNHKLLVCKNTESGFGFIEVVGIECRQLINEKDKTSRLIEYFGDSITCGALSDPSGTPCGEGQWGDQHNAYMSYGPTTARTLNAKWIISAVSGIGLIHSCCGMKITLPEVYDKLILQGDSIPWDFKKMQPDVATICLGQNDGIQDSTKFCSAYVDFIKNIRYKYPHTTIVLLTSPMADESLNKVLQHYIASVQKDINNGGDKNVYHYFFKKRYYHGCDTHPDVQEHQEIAAELAPFVKEIKGW